MSSFLDNPGDVLVDFFAVLFFDQGFAALDGKNQLGVQLGVGVWHNTQPAPTGREFGLHFF